MQERLVDAAERLGLDARSRRIMLTMPGLSFGFAPRNFDGFVERIDCPSCSRMMDFMDAAMRPSTDSFADDVRVAPIRARNAAARATFERRRAWPLVGRFFKEPTYEPEVPPAEDLIARLDAFKAACPKHWGTEEARAISEELMGNYVRADSLVHGTVSE